MVQIISLFSGTSEPSCLRLAVIDPSREGWSAFLTEDSEVTLRSALTSCLWLSSQSPDSLWICCHYHFQHLPLQSIDFGNVHKCKHVVPALMELIAQ